jgi:hypothetical protein
MMTAWRHSVRRRIARVLRQIVRMARVGDRLVTEQIRKLERMSD